MEKPLVDRRICVTGGAGFLGRAVCARLRQRGAKEVFVPRSREFDLTHANTVSKMFDRAQPDLVIHLAAEVGGIGANQKQPGRFFYANMAMGLHLIEEARRRGIDKFVQVGTVCAYPEVCDVPFCEESLWDGFPEPTNAPYGVAKRALSVMLEAYRAQYGFNGVYLIPVNLYGPGDNFDPSSSHVIPGMIRRFTEAAGRGDEVVECWGSGRVSREFLYVDDAAAAIVRAAEVHDDSSPINLGTGREIKVSELARRIAGLCGFTGRIVWDPSKPAGQLRRRLDTLRAGELLGWTAQVGLDEGLRRTVESWRDRAGVSGDTDRAQTRVTTA